MIKRILVPLDGSDVAKAVLPYVVELGQQCKAEVILFQVAEKVPLGRSGGTFRPEFLNRSAVMLPETPQDVETAQHPIYKEQEMAALRAQLEQDLAEVARSLRDKGIEVRIEIGFGDPAAAIIDFAEQHEVDLIALASHGRSGLTRWIFGSVAEKVLRGTYLPVLLIRPPGADQIFRLPPPVEFEL
jgi:nucleotide-binding universal stress UspA family protein